jgi:hypothetical protein
LGDEAASFYRGEAAPFDKEEFFKKQIEECRELESQAVSAEDRAFWRQAVGRWEEQLRQAQRGKFKSRTLKLGPKLKRPSQKGGLFFTNQAAEGYRGMGTAA